MLPVRSVSASRIPVYEPLRRHLSSTSLKEPAMQGLPKELHGRSAIANRRPRRAESESSRIPVRSRTVSACTAMEAAATGDKPKKKQIQAKKIATKQAAGKEAHVQATPLRPRDFSSTIMACKAHKKKEKVAAQPQSTAKASRRDASAPPSTPSVPIITRARDRGASLSTAEAIKSAPKQKGKKAEEKADGDPEKSEPAVREAARDVKDRPKKSSGQDEDPSVPRGHVSRPRRR